MIEEQLLTLNPFPGLRPFETGEECIFFGRDGHCDALLEKLRATRFTTVVGASGSGKSSLVRAGLLPALKSGFMWSAGARWRFAVFRPGNNPIRNLANALNAPDVLGTECSDESAKKIEETLRESSFGLIETVRQAAMHPHENLLLVVDQFEELYRFPADSPDETSKDDTSAFVKLLLEAARQTEFPIYIVLTVRSDYLGDSTRFWGLPEAINDGQYLIPRMTDDERREVILGPITVCGGEITLPLINRLLNDAGNDPNHLPILQHALMRTWDYWKRTTDGHQPLDIHHYETIGGMAKALSLHADEAYHELLDDGQKIAEKMFKRLTGRDKGKDENRRHANLSSICQVADASEDEVIRVIDVFRKEGRSFVLPSHGISLKSDTVIDISHESLIGGWERLGNWVDDEAQSARIYQRLAEDAVLNKESKSALLIDPGLQVALDWRDEYEPNKAWAQRYKFDFELAMSYLDESKRQHDFEVSSKGRRRRRLMVISWVVAAVLGVLALMTLNYFRARRQVAMLGELGQLYNQTIDAMLKEDTENTIDKSEKLSEFYTRPEMKDARDSNKELLFAESVLIAISKAQDPTPLATAPTSGVLDAEKRHKKFIEAIDHFEGISNKLEEKDSANREAMFYMKMGDIILNNRSRAPSDAIFFYEKAISLWRADGNNSMRAYALMKKGDAQVRLGGLQELKGAITSYEEGRPLQLTADAGAKSDGDQVSTYIKIGNVYRKLNMWQEAINSFSEALKISRIEQYENGQVNALIELGDILAESDSREALKYFEQAVDIFKGKEGFEKKGDVPKISNGKGSMAMRSKGNSKINDKGDLLRLIGNLYSDKGNWRQAAEFYKRANEFYHAQGTEGVAGEAQTYGVLGDIYRRQGQCEAALRSYGLATQRYQAVQGKGKGKGKGKDEDNESSITMLVKSLRALNCNKK